MAHPQGLAVPEVPLVMKGHEKVLWGVREQMGLRGAFGAPYSGPDPHPHPTESQTHTGPVRGAPTAPPFPAPSQAPPSTKHYPKHLSPRTTCLKASGHLQMTECPISRLQHPTFPGTAGWAPVQRDHSRSWQKAEEALLGTDHELSLS